MLATSYPKYAGDATAPFIAEIAAGVVRHGVAVRVVLPWHREFQHAPVEAGVELHTYRYAPFPQLAVWGYAEALHADVGLRRQAMLAAPFGLAASTIALWQQVRVFKPDVIHAHWVIPNGLPAALCARLFGLPLVVSMHGSDVSMAERNRPFRTVARWIFAQSAAATACSGDLHQRALALGATASTTSTVPYGVAVEQFAPTVRNRAWVAERFGVAADVPLLVAVGRFVYKKGFHRLIEALPRIQTLFPQARLVLAGYGDLRDSYAEYAQKLGVAEMLIMPGQLLRDDVAALLASADVYVVPSVHDESGNVDGLPNALLEGMAAGCAVVASDVAGIPEVLVDGVHGRLVPEGDVASLADALIVLLTDPALRAHYGEQARQRITTELTWDAMTRRLIDIYAEVLRT
jgi:glycosyltransferase involved in cell wall biosynthesis